MKSVILILVCFVISACEISPNITVEETEPNGSDAAMSAMKDGWSVSGFLGTGERIVSTPSGGLTQSDLSLQAVFSEEDGGPGAQYFTLQFNVNPPGGGVFYAYADVTWSVMGNATTRRISVVDGAVISGTAQFVKVSIFDKTSTDLLTAVGNVPEPYYVTACVTRGARPSTQQPPRLVPDPDPGNTSTVPGFYVVTFGTPVTVEFAQSAGIISSFITCFMGDAKLDQGDVTVEFVTGTGFTIQQFDMSDMQGIWIPMPPGCSAVQFTNNDNVFDANIGLVLGVEG